MLFDLILSMLAALLVFPLISGYYAYTHGRSFWLWFAMGCFLPIISYILLLLLPDKTHPLEKELESIKLEYGMLGSRSEFSNKEYTYKKLLAQPRNRIQFVVDEPQNTVSILIDEKPFVHMVRGVEYMELKENSPSDPLPQYAGLPLKLVQMPSGHLLGKPHLFYKDRSKRSAIMVCQSTQNPEEKAFFVQIESFPQYIVWSNYSSHPHTHWQYEKLPILIFDKVQYLEALHALSEEKSDR